MQTPASSSEAPAGELKTEITRVKLVRRTAEGELIEERIYDFTEEHDGNDR